MKIFEVYKKLDEFSPFSLQEDWDNSGLLIGSFDDEFECINVCLDIDEEIVKNAKEKTLFITHHPLIFKGLKRIDAMYPSSILKKIIMKSCYLVSMHTNIDKTHLNRYVAENILEQEVEECENFVCYFDVDMSFDELVLYVKEKLNINFLKVVRTDKKIKRVALTTGS
ncbi:MAG: Nif3-like dinuclear metal center hexameric protein, partial [Campylobacteraceae bacterium]|nr:Nif3-like dinuclear metal center hexameric protein [Campylobacteraceae bacterium]